MERIPTIPTSSPMRQEEPSQSPGDEFTPQENSTVQTNPDENLSDAIFRLNGIPIGIPTKNKKRY
ncbi:hypothetical protein H8F22_25875 [Pseudomonas sp. P154a]|uniref:hypothetical protein n=1 Tax=Pseudomonas mucoides TaxID=2730424 RepID=UPI001891F43F|nr:hypothetical protein [Pseudomonas mucoides]MBF6042310.1 hypothetical protein [Pseudomonas mucoides]